ncbi:tyrosine-protein phosphatase [Rhizomonospora bruguierae]|uniref:tyrosine-protein phosphatase n=1 Tax=Rhizomonospora bruguierae TaxID=1581705 RepID=UPI001BCAC024|nr:tyrosine-protein phosphatase [Micromonospora sp. NBRC 107566]
MVRSLTFSNLFNFRDVGGYPTADGRAVRWRRLFRADSLHRLTGTGRQDFAALGVRTVVDLRRPKEISRHGRVFEDPGLGYRHIHPEHQDWDEIPYDARLGMARYLADRYRDLTEQGAAGLVNAISVIADPATAPVVVHCAAGKDRTGVVCALALSVLGVSDEDIAEDYALSTLASERFADWLRANLPHKLDVPPPWLAAPAEAMLLFLAELRERHGSAEGYLTRAGLPPARIDALRENLLTG